MKNFRKAGIFAATILFAAVAVTFTACEKEDKLVAEEAVAGKMPDVYVKEGVLRMKDFETLQEISEKLSNNEEEIPAFLEEVGFTNSMFQDYIDSKNKEQHVFTQMVMSYSQTALMSDDGLMVVGTTLTYFDGKSEYVFESFNEETINDIRGEQQGLQNAIKKDVSVSSKLKGGSYKDFEETFNVSGIYRTVKVTHEYSRWTTGYNIAKMKSSCAYTLYNFRVTGSGEYQQENKRGGESNWNDRYGTDIKNSGTSISCIVYDKVTSRYKFNWRYVKGQSFFKFSDNGTPMETPYYSFGSGSWQN